MKFSIGQKVVLSREGHKTFDRRSPKAKKRTIGEITGKSAKYADCVYVKWSHRRTDEMLHVKFLKSVQQ